MPLEEFCPGAPSATLVEARSVELERCLTTFLASGLALARRTPTLSFTLVEGAGRAWDGADLAELTGVAVELEETAGGAGAVGVEDWVAVLDGRVGAVATGAGSGLRPGFGLAGGLTGCGWASAEPAPSQRIPSEAAITSRVDDENLSNAPLRCPRHRAGRVKRASPVLLSKS